MARATIRDVAAHAGVSRQTVSNAFNDPDHLSAETLERVRRSVAALNYRPSNAARALSSARSRLVGVRVGGPAHLSVSNRDPLLNELVRAAGPLGYNVVLFDAQATDDSEITAFDELWQRRAVDGFLVYDTHPGDARPAWLTRHHVPFVAFGTPWGQARNQHVWIDVDGAAGLGRVVDHLVERGHRQIAFLGWPTDRAGGDARRRGWTSAMKRHGLGTALNLTAAADDIESAVAVASAVLSGSHATAVACASDVLATGVLLAAQQAGRIPGVDLAVTGYDDSVIARTSRPQLTSLHQPLDAVAAFAVAHIVGEVSGVPRAKPRSRLMTPTLIVRGSSSFPVR
jgi:LacI family transcriptional regulator